jgi:hypothetical protein
VDISGTLTASDGASISRNTAVSLNGYAQGGGLKIGEGCTAVLSASAVDGNTARTEGSGTAFGGGVDTLGVLTARDGASISSNTAFSMNGQANGGGLRIDSGGTAVLSASAVDGNTARAEGSGSAIGGGIAIGGGVHTVGALTASDGTSISSNAAVSVNGEAQGGGLKIGEGCTAVLTASAVDGNTARAEGIEGAYGGGVLTLGVLTASDGASISHNTAVSLRGKVIGGGVTATDKDDISFGFACAVALNDSSVFNNTARAERGAVADGGGLATFCNLTVRNATIVGNRALAASGTCRGGGLFHAGRPALLHGGVIDGNVAVGRVASGSQVLDWL